MGTGAEGHNFILIEHLAPFEISVGCLVVDDSIHDEEYVSWVAAFFGDEVTNDILFRLELFKIPGVEIVITALQKAMNVNRIFI